MATADKNRCTTFVAELRKLFGNHDVLTKLWNADVARCTATPEVVAETTARVQLVRTAILVCVEHMLAQHAPPPPPDALRNMRRRMAVADKLLRMLFRTSGQVASASGAGGGGQVVYEGEGVLVHTATGVVAHTYLMEGEEAAEEHVVAAIKELEARVAHASAHVAAGVAAGAQRIWSVREDKDAAATLGLPAVAAWGCAVEEEARLAEDEAQLAQLCVFARQFRGGRVAATMAAPTPPPAPAPPAQGARLPEAPAV